ncbi:MAG: hypothetical protein II744_07525, partial [Eubacterium sp.]|nr:hypothetical protein [Eubacterium sp.]
KRALNEKSGANKDNKNGLNPPYITIRTVSGLFRNAQVVGSSPTSSSKASFQEAFIYAVLGHFRFLKSRKIETEKSEIHNRKSRQKI